MQRCQMHKAPQKARDLHPSLINQQQLKAISESFLLNLVNGVRSSSDRRPFWDEWELNSLDRRGKSRNSIWVIVATGAASLFVNCLGGGILSRYGALLSCETKIHPDDCVSFLEGTRRRCVLLRGINYINTVPSSQPERSPALLRNCYTCRRSQRKSD